MEMYSMATFFQMGHIWRLALRPCNVNPSAFEQPLTGWPQLVLHVLSACPMALSSLGSLAAVVEDAV